MPVLENNIKLVKSAVMLDVPEGGGPPSANVVEDGVSNAIFDDISELARAGGNVSMRKTHVVVQTADTDGFFGTNVIVAEPPQDPRVSVTLFSTRATFDTRAEAQTRVEAYLNKGAEWAGYLYENHIAGQRVIQLFQRPNAEVPNVGHTLTLVYAEGLAGEKEQYVRATEVSVVIQLFYDADSKQDYEAAVVTVSLSDALRYDFKGSPAARTFTRATDSTKIRDTVVADAGTYVGVVPLTDDVEVGDFTIKADSIYTQLVPSAQTEIPIPLSKPYAASALPIPGADLVTYTATHNWTSSISFCLPCGLHPGSLSIVTNGVTIYDEGGVLRTGSGQIGTVDYANGILTLSTGSMNGSKAVTFRPAAQVLRAPQSTMFEVTQESRSMSYVGAIFPVPQPITTSVSYMVGGRWYVLSDNGLGVLKGTDDSYGAGTLNYNTGAFVVTLGALPDVGSVIMITWNAPTQETALETRALKIEELVALGTPDNKAMQPDTLVLTWDVNGVTKTANGQITAAITGDATGEIHVAQDYITFQPNILPAVGSIISVEYYYGPKVEEHYDIPSRDQDGKMPILAGLGTILPGSLEVEWNTWTDESVLGTYTRAQILEMGITLTAWIDPIHRARDDGDGNLVLNGDIIGTVDYNTGSILYNPDTTVKLPKPIYRAVPVAGTGRFRLIYTGMEYLIAPTVYRELTLNDANHGYVEIRYNSVAAQNQRTAEFAFYPAFKLVPEVEAQIVPGSVLLTVTGSQPWGDNGTGNLREFTTNGWVNRGTINYVNGNVTLTSWVTSTPNSISRKGCVVTTGEQILNEYVFRTRASPVRPGSLSIQFAKAQGGTQTLTAALDGTITATGISGSIDWESGVVKLLFGQWVTAAGNESQPWYDVARVEGGQAFRPEPVAAASVSYTAVAYSYLPLDASILGIDPVRLPSDGRVPIFRPGGFAVVGNTQSYGPVQAVAQNTTDVGRTRLSRIRVIGNDGSIITEGYTHDLDAGTVTWDNVSLFSQPVTIEHRIEDMAQISDVQINGQLSFTRPMTHDYPTLNSYVSSALIGGDLRARVSLTFDQATWNSTWSDSLVGNGATASYNATVYPITVTNAGAVTERWIIRFTSSTAFELIGEHVGVIATGNTSTELSPNNPVTQAPYFTVNPLGWGQGWSVGNILRINTIGAQFPVWVVRTVKQGPETINDDAFTVLVRGDVDSE